MTFEPIDIGAAIAAVVIVAGLFAIAAWPWVRTKR